MRKFVILTSIALLASALPVLGQQYRYNSGST
jgi:hypothetical protein